jgi:hypothetical protein
MAALTAKDKTACLCQPEDDAEDEDHDKFAGKEQPKNEDCNV